jgi:hypothetical protein
MTSITVNFYGKRRTLRVRLKELPIENKR